MARQGSMVALVALVSGLIAAPARGDVIGEWNEYILTNVPGLPGQRALTIAHLAMFDAVNSIEHGYTSYAVQLNAPAGASTRAAAAAAGYGVLARLFPAQQAAFQIKRDALLAQVPDGAAESDGVALGDAVAAALVASRASDNMLLPNPPYIAGSGPGAYQPTGPVVVNAAAALWVPFAMTSASQFRANGPVPVGHPKYAGELDEVREFGAANSGSRTQAQSLSALWHVEMAHFGLNRVARAAAVSEGLSLLEGARLFALLNIAMMDGVVAVFESKHFYDYWRPITAIRGADDDGNDDTVGDPTWTTYIGTPPHPEYPAAHGTVSAAGAEVLKSVFGQHYAFTATSSAPGMAGIVRSFEDFDAFVTDAQLARIYGGVHFRTSVVEGARQGKKVAKWVQERYLLPVH